MRVTCALAVMPQRCGSVASSQLALPLGGAYVGQGSSMMLNTVPWGVAVPGHGRSVYVGFNYKF